MTKVYLACYRGRADKPAHRLCDTMTRFFTRGKYSHCELAVPITSNTYQCYSSSYRDGGVRTKVITLDPNKWDLFHSNLNIKDLEAYYEKTKGSQYDLLGALGCVSGLRQNKDSYFCSEWCFNAMFNSDQGWRFSPAALAAIV